MVVFLKNSEELVTALREAFSWAKEARVAIAYCRESGIQLLEGLLASADLGHLSVKVLTSVDFGLTSSGALEDLATRPGFHTKVYRGGFSDRPNALHAKAWILTDATRFAALVGSSNLTGGGLRDNVEANLLVQGIVNDPLCRELVGWFDQLWDDSSVSLEVTDELLAVYEEAVAGLQFRRVPLALPARVQRSLAYVAGMTFARGVIGQENALEIHFRFARRVASPVDGSAFDQESALSGEMGLLLDTLKQDTRTAGLEVSPMLDHLAGSREYRIRLPGMLSRQDFSWLASLATPGSRFSVLEFIDTQWSDSEILRFFRGMTDVAANLSQGTAGDVILYFARDPDAPSSVESDRGRCVVRLCSMLEDRLGVPVNWILWPEQRTHAREFQLRIFPNGYRKVGFSLPHRQMWLDALVTRTERPCPRFDTTEGAPDYAFLCAQAGCEKAKARGCG